MSGTKRYYGVFIVFLVFGLMLPQKTNAQSDTTGTSAKRDSIIEYLTPLEYAFMMHEETKFMLRVPVIGVGAEVEVLPYFTLMGQAQLAPPGYLNFNVLGLTAEARWYYGSKKIGVKNMSGNYLALGYQFETQVTSNDDLNVNNFYARWGAQRRFLGSGLIDLGVNAGRKTYFSSGRSMNLLFLQTTGVIGFGLVFNDEKPLQQDRLCPVIKCFERETFLLKINTLNLLRIQYSDKSKALFLYPEIGVEQKLVDSPFSIGASLKFNFTFSESQYNDLHLTTSYFDWEGRLHARYYYNLKNRILKGKSGNGFSANYISGGILQQYSDRTSEVFDRDLLMYSLTTGLQRTFGKHFYFDMEFGGLLNIKKNSFGLEFYGAAQLGIRF